MQSGRKPISDEVKKAKGTYQPCRAYEQTAVPNVPPTMPEYLSRAARKIWREEVHRAIAAGVTDTDSSLFARYCSVEALSREKIEAGDLLSGNLLTELRRMGECLGLTGPSSRMAKAKKAAETSPFAMFVTPTGSA